MTNAADILNQARSWIGTVEDPAGSNHNGITEHFANLSGWDWARQGNPWCDMSVSCWLTDGGIATTYAYCPSHVNAFKAAGQWVGDGNSTCLPGDIVFFDWDDDGVADHVGIVEGDNGSSAVYTIEGNAGTPEGVWRHSRPRSLILGFGRPSYSDANYAPPPEDPQLPPPPSATDGRVILRRGSTGQAVKNWQTLVQATPDGDFGPDTEAKTKAFQTAASIEVDGVVGSDTYAAMDKLLAYLSATAAGAASATPVEQIPSFPGTTRYGSRGDAVAQVQQRLADRGWNIAVDGIFGNGTAGIVAQFQAQDAVEADGIAGPITWSQLWTAPIT